MTSLILPSFIIVLYWIGLGIILTPMKDNLKCPICQSKMELRTQNREHVNSKSLKVTKQKYYQYYCLKCDDDKTGWTTTESDNESLKIK